MLIFISELSPELFSQILIDQNTSTQSGFQNSNDIGDLIIKI